MCFLSPSDSNLHERYFYPVQALPALQLSFLICVPQCWLTLRTRLKLLDFTTTRNPKDFCRQPLIQLSKSSRRACSSSTKIIQASLSLSFRRAAIHPLPQGIADCLQSAIPGVPREGFSRRKCIKNWHNSNGHRLFLALCLVLTYLAHYAAGVMST